MTTIISKEFFKKKIKNTICGALAFIQMAFLFFHIGYSIEYPMYLVISIADLFATAYFGFIVSNIVLNHTDDLGANSMVFITAPAIFLYQCSSVTFFFLNLNGQIDVILEWKLLLALAGISTLLAIIFGGLCLFIIKINEEARTKSDQTVKCE